MRARLMYVYSFIIILMAFSQLYSQGLDNDFNTSTDLVSNGLREHAVETLYYSLNHGNDWVKVHAAEYLILLDYRNEVKEVFLNELRKHGNQPIYRIGIWRVMARLELDPDDKRIWIEKIIDVAVDNKAVDQLHAVESLGKLGYQINQQYSSLFKNIAFKDDSRIAAYASWILINSNNSDGISRLKKIVSSQNDTTSGTAAYIFRNLSEVTPEVVETLRTKFNDLDSDSYNYVFFLSALFKHAGENQLQYKNNMLQYLSNARFWEQYQICEALAEVGVPGDIPELKKLLDSESLDVQSAASNAILRIERRIIHGLSSLDWFILGLYFIGMLIVGWVYSRRTKNTEDYLLGGRSMKPWAVGLSLFATLFSALTYLALPGEMIKFGPMVLAQLAAFPFVIWIVGWFLIPFFMRLKVTSAYEILAIRLGEGIRTLGSFFFLTLRLLWMAVIVYATASKVIVPLFGWEPSTIPYISAALGIITVIYTSMGGIKAVVFTDVVQSFILFGGAVLTIIIISNQMGGIQSWFPNQWASHWEAPKFWFESGSRMTFAMAMLSGLVWYICTAGSDQVAVQRYLSTENLKAARRMYTTSILFNGLVLSFLGILGLALLSFFRENPRFVPDAQTIVSDADQLFPQFISIGLPTGVSGLVIAALLAAAMSSLSSGINSACSVISVDFVDKIKRKKGTEQNHIQRTKYISWIVGFFVVFLSLFASLVEGNLLAVAFKVANLLTAPLFVLFFMSMFVPWATIFGTWMAALLSVAAAVGIAYFNIFGLSFIWLMPVSLVTGVLAGVSASLLPIGPPPKPPLPKENSIGD